MFEGQPLATSAPPITTEAEYEAALAELEPIFGAARGTPDGDHALRLFDAIEAYASVHYPMGEPSAEALSSRGISVVQSPHRWEFVG